MLATRPACKHRQSNTIDNMNDLLIAAAWILEELFVQGVPEPFVLDPDGCLDLSSLQFDPKVMIVNGKRGLVGPDGRMKRNLTDIRDILGDHSVGTLHKPFQIAKALPLQSFSLTDQPSFATVTRSPSLLYPTYSMTEKQPEPGSSAPANPSTSIPASRPPIQTPIVPAATPAVPATLPMSSAMQTNGPRNMPMVPPQLIPPPMSGAGPPMDPLRHPGVPSQHWWPLV